VTTNLMLAGRRGQNEAILEELLASPAYPFDDRLPKLLPAEQGLYVIEISLETGSCDYLHAGRSTGRRDTGLRGRIWDDHFCGGGKGARGDLVQKVISNLYAEIGVPRAPAGQLGPRLKRGFATGARYGGSSLRITI